MDGGGLNASLSTTDYFGRAVAGLGDLDGDGIPDMVVGAPLDDDGGTGRGGAVYVLFMNADSTVKAEQKISSSSLVAALDDLDRFGISVAGLGDLDGDGLPDMAVGAYHDDDGGVDRGAVYVLFLNADGTVKALQKISSSTLTAALSDGDSFGISVAGLGDLDGDGLPDMAVGAHHDDMFGGSHCGVVHVLLMHANGTVKADQKISNGQGGLATPLAIGDMFGESVAGLGDVDGDGHVDMAVGASYDDEGGVDRGAVHVLFMNANGTVKAAQKIGSSTFTAALDDGDRFGISVAGLGDVDGDGLPDLAVGAHKDDDGGVDRGAVRILFMNADGTVKAEQKLSSTRKVVGLELARAHLLCGRRSLLTFKGALSDAPRGFAPRRCRGRSNRSARRLRLVRRLGRRPGPP